MLIKVKYKFVCFQRPEYPKNISTFIWIHYVKIVNGDAFERVIIRVMLIIAPHIHHIVLSNVEIYAKRKGSITAANWVYTENLSALSNCSELISKS